LKYAAINNFELEKGDNKDDRNLNMQGKKAIKNMKKILRKEWKIPMLQTPPSPKEGGEHEDDEEKNL
jgi:hypothetical protein